MHLSAVLVHKGLVLSCLEFLETQNRTPSSNQALTKAPSRFIVPQTPYLGVSGNKGHWGFSKTQNTWKLHFLLPVPFLVRSFQICLWTERGTEVRAGKHCSGQRPWGSTSAWDT